MTTDRPIAATLLEFAQPLLEGNQQSMTPEQLKEVLTLVVTVWNAVVGTFLFHALIVVVSLAGQSLLHSAQVGEYLREFAAFAIIGTTLALHAWRGKGRRA